MEEEKSVELKEKVEKILKNVQIDTTVGETKLIEILQEIKEREIKDEEIDLIEKTITNIQNYFYAKQQMEVKVNDYEYLKNIAEILRNQKIRIEDNVVCGQPVFKVILGEDEVYYFITREGAKIFVETHSTQLKEVKKDRNNENSGERRKKDLTEVTINKNLEIGKIIEIIKRNY